MGLDAWVIWTKDDIVTPVDFDYAWASYCKYDDPDVRDLIWGEELHYWRKFHDIHGWMEELYRAKGGKKESFDTVSVQLKIKDIFNFSKDVEDKKLPDFSPTKGMDWKNMGVRSRKVWLNDEKELPIILKEDYLGFVDKALEALENRYNIFYTSWW